MTVPDPHTLSPRDLATWPVAQEDFGDTVAISVQMRAEYWSGLAALIARPDDRLGHSELWNVEGALENFARYAAQDITYMAALALEARGLNGKPLSDKERRLAEFLAEQQAEQW